ncbi:MAG: DedA family protein [Candidatus Cloacimonetes bacterium]|nr:DedA family protein [Candidatus Cloacimonadota bacterium]
MIEQMVNIILDIFSQMGYLGIVVLMTISYSFIPFSSQVVIPPAAYLASQGELKLYLVIFYGTLGGVLGALFNYFFALFFGRVVIYKIVNTRIARLCRLNPEKIQRAEDYFVKHGKISIFLGLLIPAVRQLISLPAGLAKMNLAIFIPLAIISALIWNTYLALLGFYFGENQDFIFKNIKEISLCLLIIGAIISLYLVFKRKK